jgi:drug/metabolite transporter (DMT)-like permease
MARLCHARTVERRAWILIGFLASLWGASYLFIKIGLHDFSPAMVVFLRTLLAAIVLAPLALRRGALSGLRGAVGPIVLLAAMQVAIPFVLISWGEEEVSSSLAGILVASAPILTALLAVFIDHDERPSLRGAGGIFMASSAWACCWASMWAATRPRSSAVWRWCWRAWATRWAAST